jgi:hypothetical protein
MAEQSSAHVVVVWVLLGQADERGRIRLVDLGIEICPLDIYEMSWVLLGEAGSHMGW